MEEHYYYLDSNGHLTEMDELYSSASDAELALENIDPSWIKVMSTHEAKAFVVGSLNVLASGANALSGSPFSHKQAKQIIHHATEGNEFVMADIWDVDNITHIAEEADLNIDLDEATEVIKLLKSEYDSSRGITTGHVQALINDVIKSASPS